MRISASQNITNNITAESKGAQHLN
jgi:hypothetical protein